MADPKIRVAITGAAGQIGYALLFRVASGQMFGPNTRITLQLLELESALPSLRGTIMELEDCAFPLLDAVMATSDPDKAFEGAHWVLMVGSVPRKKGMERSELLGINGMVFTAQGKSIDKHADPSVRIFVVGNPCNTNCLIAMHNAPSIPKNRFFAMTALDENRARTQLAKKAAVSLDEVKNLAVWGNHSSKQFPDFTNARIGKKSAADAIADEQWLKQTFVPMIQQRGAAVIEARGSSSAASAANAVVDGVRRLLDETPEGTCFSVSKFSCGEYGVPKGLIFSFPCRVHNGNVEVVERFSITPYVKQCIDGVINELQEEYNAVKSLKLIP